MENVSTGVLDKHNEHYLSCKDTAKKSYHVLRHVQLHMSKYQYNYGDLQSIMSNLQPNSCLKVDFQKGGPTYRGQEVVNPRHQDD